MKNVKRLFVLTLVLSLLAGMLLGCGGTQTPASPPPDTGVQAPAPGGKEDASPPAPKAKSAVMITDTGGLGDGGFNDMAWHGLEMVRDELGYEIGIIESYEAAQYAPNIAQAAEQGYDVVVCVGFLFIDALADVAPQYPDTVFIMIDAEVEGDNVYSFVFDVQESSFLAGALAGLVCEENVFGYVGGMEIPDVLAWESGYISGIRTTRPDADIKTAYVGTFADPGKAKELALAQFSAGAGVCMEVSSGGAIGVIEAARDAGKMFISTDKSKDAFAPGCEFTSALAKRDYALLNAIRMIDDGTAKPGTTVLSTKDGIFGLPDNTEARYGADVMAIINKLQAMIASGELIVPATRDEVAAYTPPVL